MKTEKTTDCANTTLKSQTKDNEYEWKDVYFVTKSYKKFCLTNFITYQTCK